MAQITGGKVSVEDSKPHSNDEYGRKKVAVELSFAVGEGEDYTATFDLASEAAENRVKALLNGVSFRVVGGNEVSPPAEAPKRRRRTNAEIAADNAAKAAGTTAGSSSGAPPTGGNTGGGSSADPGALEDPTGGEENTIHLPDESGGLEDEDEGNGLEDEGGDLSEFDVPAQPQTADVSDADLASAVTKRNGELKDPDLIRNLIAAYNPDPTKPFQLRQIAADKRPEFLTKLAALKKVG